MRKKFLLMLTVLVIALGGSGKLFAQNVAKVGNTEYATIGEAIAAWTNNTTLTLLADVTLSDVVTLNSTEHHILNLGTYTMTAASGKNAFVIKACGTGDAERTAITINADATNPGGINAGSKCVVYYKYADGGISGNDRPIIKINGGVFAGSTSSWGTAGIYTIGTAARKCATLNIAGGTFNCSINGSGKSKLIVSGGIFNYSVGSQGDSTALRLISGGTFKTFGFMTADSNNTKFWFGTSMGNSNVGVHVDDNGYIVVGGAVITEAGDKFEASSTNYSGANSLLQYSSAKNNGLYYTSVEEAFADNNTTSGKVTVYAEEVDMAGINFKGTIVVPEGKTVKIKNAPEGLKTEGNAIVKPVAKIGETNYLTLEDAVEEAQAGDEIVVIANFADVTVDVTKNLTIRGDVTLNNVGINANGADALTVKGLTFTGNSWINSGTAEALTVSGVTANVAPSNTSYTNSRSAFISLGRSEGQELALTVENSNITVTAAGADAILGWAKITAATITGNVIKGSNDGYFTNADAIKFMSIADGAEFVVNNNEIYSNYNGIVFAQNTTRDNAYSVSADANKFYGGADHIWIEISGGNTVHATFNATSANTVNGNAFTVADIKYHSSVIKNWTSYAGVDVVTDSNGKVIGGTLASFSNKECIAEGYELNADGGVAKIYVAKIGETKYATLSKAFAAVTADDQTVVVLRDVTENLTSTLRGNITTENGAKVTITLTNSDWVYCPYTFVVGENVTLNVPYLFYYAGGAQINGKVVANAYYQRYAGTRLTINEPGNMTVTTEMFYLRYTEGDANAGIYINGDNNDETTGLNLAVAYFYQGMINAKNANIKAGTYWQTNDTDSQGSANLVLDNSELVVSVYDHPAKATGNSTVTLTNGSILNAQNGGFTYGDNTVLSVDATSRIIGKGGEDVKLPVAQIGTTNYKTLAEAVNAVQEGQTITIFAGEISEGTIKLPSTLKNVKFLGAAEHATVLKDMTIIAADGNSVHYEGLTFDGITFDNSNVVLTGWRTGEVVYKDITVNNCIFKNIVRTSNEAAFHINCGEYEAVNGFTFTNNVIDGVSGASNSGVYAQLTGNVTFTGNVINNVAFRPYVIQLTTDDGVADTFTVKGNTFSGSKAGRAQGLGNNAEGTDNVNIVVSNNIFKGITDAQQICYWNFNAAKTTAVLSGNYYDIDVLANPGKIYFNTSAQGVGDLVEMGIFPYYTELNADGTINTESAVRAPAAIAKIGEKNYYSLQKALNDAAAGTGNVTVEILDNINLTGNDWNPVTVSAPGYPVVTVEGNYKTIEGLNDMLFAGTWAGNSGLIIKNLTIDNSTIENDKNDAAGNVGVGAFVGFPQASSVITLDNCHLVNSTVEGGHWTGGLIGYAAGYAGTDGPVFMNLTIKGCSVTGSTITGKGSVGGIIGHGSGNAWTMVEIKGTTVSGNTITSTGTSVNKAGAVMGTIGAAGQATTVNGVEKQGGALVDATVSGNTVTSHGTAITTIYGRQGTNTGVLELNGGSYDNYPIEKGVAYAKPAEGFVIKENANGTFGVKSFEGEGTAEKPYMINDLEELIAFRNSVNSGAKTFSAPGVYVTLGADIDLNNEEWTPIGNITYDSKYVPVDASKVFSGIFDGNGNTISNLKVLSHVGGVDEDANVGLFGITGAGAVIKNLTLTNVNIYTDGRNVGALAGYAYNATLENIIVNGKIQIEGGNNVSGVAGMTRHYDVTATNITVSGEDGSAIVGNNIVGGIFAEIAPNGSEQNFDGLHVENIAITGVGGVGGIVGLLTQGTVKNVSVKNVVLTGKTEYQGNAMGRIRLGSVAGLMGGKYATIADETIENVTAKNLDGNAVELPVIGANYDASSNATEAKIGDKYYATFAAAYKVAQAGDVINLFADIKATEVILLDKSLTINGNGHKVTSSATRVFRVTTANTEVTLNNVNMVNTAVRVGTNDIRGISVDNVDNVKLTLNNCSVDFTDASACDWAYAVNVTGGNNHAVTINGGTYEGANVINVLGTTNTVVVKDATLTSLYPNNDVYYGACIYVKQDQNSSVEATGNTFNGSNAIAFNVGYTPVEESDNTDNTKRVVAKIENTYYTSLKDAFAAVGGDAVVIELLDNATLNYGAREAYGTAETTSLTINGNGKVLTLNQTNSDWSSFGLANADAKVVFNNMTIEKTGKGDTSGAWNTHAIIFSSNVEMNEVTVNNAIAVQAGATLNNVTINEANGYYGLWINGNGQSVTMNGGSITATNGGRGIKIADQYIDNPAQVTLNVTGTVFKTAKKAAVLVSSKAGAKIAASNVNIENVAADKVNFVWVDEDWAANYGNVEVTGATVAQEGKGSFVAAVEKDAKVQAYYKDLHAAMVAAKAGETVVLIADVDLAGTEWEPVSFGGTFDGNGKIISNLTINKPGVSNTGFIKSLNGTVKNVTFTNPTVTGGENTAVVAGRAGGSAALAENITINGTIKVETTHSGYARAAAIVGGWAYGNYKNITVDGGDKANSYIKHTGGGDGRYVAGIVGHADDVNSYVNCTVKNITISGGWLCGGIAGPGPADKLASDCSVENIDINADYSGGMFGWYYGAGTIENPTIKNVTFTDGSTNNGVVGGYGHNTDATVTNLTFENVQNSDGKPLLDHVASIGDNHYFTLADAVNAADNNATISLIWKEGKAPIAMNASLYGKNVTITGTATVDWSKGFLFVGRGGEGNATLTFDGAKLTSASNNASTGIHVSGREKGTNNKYDGTVVIKNSTIDLDYLINKGEMTLDKATLTVKNGFAIGGRPASETESGADATATITLNNGSKVVVNYHNGMGLGYEAIGVMNINEGSTFECTQDFLVTAKGTMNVNGGIVTTKVKITNNGVINVSGESTLNIASFEGEDINFLDGAIINNSTIGGDVFVAGNVTFRGDNTFNMLYDYGTLTDYYGTTAPMKWTVEEGASLTLTNKARYGLGYGDNVTIIGSIANALEARENLTENERSLFMHGLVAQESKGWNCNSALTVENAYVVIGNNNSFGNKPGNYGGTYTFNIKNSVVDASRITFYEALSATTFTFDGSDVKMGTFMTNDADSKFTLKDSKVLSTTTTNGTDEGNYNAGQLILENSSLTYSATLTNKGTIELDATSKLTAPTISGTGTITIDAANFVIGGGDVQVVYATINVDENNINVVNNNYVTAVITETGIVIKENNLEGEGKETNPYIVSSLTELELFRNKVNAGDNYAGKYVKLSADVNLSATRSANNWEPIGTTANPFKGIFDGDNKVISNLVVEGENYVGLFGYADNATIKNVTINNANVKGVECVGVIAGNVYSTSLIDNCHVKGNIKVEGQTSVGGIVGKYYTKVSNCSVIGDGVATSYVKGTYVKSDFEGDNIGGIMGHGGENNRFTGNTVKNITISGTRKVGGVVGVTDKATQVVNCVVENVNIETTATADYAASNKAKSGHGAIVGSYTTGGTAGLVADCVVKNVNFINEDNVTVSAGPITGGARGGSDSMLAPEGVTSSNNDIYMSTITGSNNLYLMNAVAKIGEVEYYTLQDAFNAGGEVVVLRDIVLTEGVTVKAVKEVVLDLNGFAVSYTSSDAGEDMITNRGDLTIVDGSTAKTGKITYKNTDATANNVTVSTISTEPGSTLVVNGGTIENKTVKADGSSIYSYAIDLLTNGNLGDVNVTINGGTVYSDYMAIRQFNNGTACKNSLTIKGGYIYGAKRAVQVHIDNNAAYTTIVNGTVEAGADGYSLCFFPTTSENISVLGGEFIGNVYSGSNGFIKGGTFTTDVNEYCAADFSAIPQGPTWVVKQVKGTQTRELASAGWYWFSSYIDIEGEEGLEDLQEALNGNGKEVRGQDGFTRYFKSYQSWTPGLKTVSTEEMYMINTTAPVTLILEGNFVAENRSITLNPGWNWIGYPVRVSVPVEDALANYRPEDGDMIKSKSSGFSVYNAGAWWPSFNLQPGEGYKYDSKKSVTTNFVYSTTVTNSNVSSSKSNAVAEYHWTPAVSEYAENMVVIAMLDLNGEYADDSYEVAAFANGECRGSARPIYNEKLDKHMLFMTVYGDEVEEMTFKCYDANNDREYALANVVVYSNDAVLGSIREPYIMTCNTLGIDEATISDINIYPNPTTTDREINLQATCDKVEVFNTLGVKVAEYQNVDTIDALETAGTYVIRVTLNGDVKHCRLVVK